MDDPVQQLKNDLDEGDFNPHIFRQSIHSSIWELVEQIKLTPEEEGLTPEQEKKLYDIDRNLWRSSSMLLGPVASGWKR